MNTHLASLLAAGTFAATPLLAQSTASPLPPIDSVTGAIVVNVAEFAAIPDVGGSAARMMLLVDEPGTKRLFVNDMRGPIYSVSYDGKSVAQFIDTNDSTWGQAVQSQGRERGLQSFAFHPQFAQAGAPGYGKFYTWVDLRNNQVAVDFKPKGGSNTHHTALLEWTAKSASAATYDGGPPRELLRIEQPYANHNAGMLAFNPLARPGTTDFGLLYVGVADGGSGGDPQNASQDLTNAFGKVFRIDPLGTNARSGRYGIPASNPFVLGPAPGALPEIYAYGVRNPQRFAWDPANGAMYLTDIGQNIVEEVSPVTAGANLGWNIWEGSFKYLGRTGVDAATPRGDPAMTYPIVEYAHGDPLLQRQSAVAGLHVVRTDAIPALRNKVLFTDVPQGELFYFDADNLPRGGVAGMHRVLLRAAGAEPKPLLALIREKNAQQGKQPAARADLRLGAATDGRVFLLNKADGTIRVLTRQEADRQRAIPDRLADTTFWRLVTAFSEPTGFFPSENFVSNEVEWQFVIPGALGRAGAGGAYVGVGPEQNFTYIAAFQPRIAFICDIRRQNLVQHLMYKALFELSTDRAEFLSRLWSRARPPGADTASTPAALVSVFRDQLPDSLLRERTLAAMLTQLVHRRGFALSADDSATMRTVFLTFFAAGPDISYSTRSRSPTMGAGGMVSVTTSGGGATRFWRIMPDSAGQMRVMRDSSGTWVPDSAYRFPLGPASPVTYTYATGGGSGYPTFATLMSEDDGAGVNRGWLGSEAAYQWVREFQLRNLVVPVVGNFGGDKALRSIGGWLADHGARVSAFYTSNVEQYLFQDRIEGRFYENVAAMPTDTGGIFIRSFPNSFRSAIPPRRPGSRLSQTTSSIDGVLRAWRAGSLGSYWELAALQNR